MSDYFRILKEDVIAVMEERCLVLKRDPDSFSDKMAGYLTALYDMGLLSWNDVKRQGEP